MLGTIELLDLHVRCIVGVLPYEREHEQDLYLDVALDLDLADAAGADDLAGTVDYTAVAALLADVAVTGRFQLLEALVEQGAARVLQAHPRVQRVRLAVKKPAAVPRARTTLVRVERSR